MITSTSTLAPVTDDTFDELVVQSKVPVLVEFWAQWCGPCHLIAPIVEQLAAANSDRITVLTMNADENRATTSALGILGLPTLQLFDGGSVVREIRGARPKSYLLAQLQGYVNE